MGYRCSISILTLFKLVEIGEAALEVAAEVLVLRYLREPLGELVRCDHRLKLHLGLLLGGLLQLFAIVASLGSVPEFEQILTSAQRSGRYLKSVACGPL